MYAIGMNSFQPLGQHLRRTDEVLTAHLGQALADQGLTRFSWQVLNVLARGGTVAQPAIAERPRWFLDGEGLGAVVDDLRGRGWVDGSRGALTLTAAGRSAHAAAARAVAAVRERSMRGIGEEEYLQVVATLERMVHNLEAA